MDSIDGMAISELVFAAGSTSTRDGYILRAPQGFGDEDPIHIWLTTP